MIMNEYYLGLIANDASKRVAGAKVTIDDQVYNYDIYRTTIENNSIKKFVYLQDDVQGLVKKVVLVDALGNELATKDVNFQKFEDGYIVVFEFKLQVQEV